MDDLEKGNYSKCTRCGKPSNGKSRCKACLKKLASKRKTPGTKERSWQHADQALRRERGGSGTTTGGHKSGHGKRQEIQRKMKAAEKKTGSKLSLDRKNNERGYESKNTRAVPQSLNRGRHHVDGKKLNNWRKKLKKNDIDTATLYTLLKAKAYHLQDENLIDLIKSLRPEGLGNLFLEDLDKSAALKLNPEQSPSLEDHVGTTHTVEVHPDMDHLYRAKGLIKENNKSSLKLIHFKQAGFPRDIIKKLPRDAEGNVTPEMLDEHIANLPKTKVNVTVLPYTWGSQQHRPGRQYALSIGMHEDSLNSMDEGQKALWNRIRGDQHLFSEPPPENATISQFGHARIDADSKPDHWHVDEIQSDFQNEKKIKNKHDNWIDQKKEEPLYLPSEGEYMGHVLRDWMRSDQYPNSVTHPASRKITEMVDKMNSARNDLLSAELNGHDSSQLKRAYHKANMDLADVLFKNNLLDRDKVKAGYKESIDRIKSEMKDAETFKESHVGDLLTHLSHGHEDPQHLIHSALNALGRKLGIKSMSMDTPKDQAVQSGLHIPATKQGYLGNWDDYMNHVGDVVNSYDEATHNDILNNHQDNVPLVSAMNKLGLNGMRRVLDTIGTSPPDDAVEDNLSPDTPESNKWNSLTDPEQHMIYEIVHNLLPDMDRYGDPSEFKDKEQKFDMSKLPVHQINTYYKRPKRLGMRTVPKEEVFGPYPREEHVNPEVQYMNLHKKIRYILEQLKKARR